MDNPIWQLGSLVNPDRTGGGISPEPNRLNQFNGRSRSDIDQPNVVKQRVVFQKQRNRLLIHLDYDFSLDLMTSVLVALMEAITEAGVSIYAHNLGPETLLASGKQNPVASIVIAVMIGIDAMETERLSERILSGLAEARRPGKPLGRPKGSVKQQDQLLTDYVMVAKDLKKGLSIRQTAVLRQVSTDTVQRVKKAMKAKQENT